MQISEEFEQNLRNLKAAFLKLYERIENLTLRLIERISIAKEKIKTHKLLLYKLNFTRPAIRHQVLDRKPKHLIKKIIH